MSDNLENLNKPYMGRAIIMGKSEEGTPFCYTYFNRKKIF